MNNRKHHVLKQQKLSSILSNMVGVKYSCFVNELFTLMSHSALMENEFGSMPAVHQLFSGYGHLTLNFNVDLVISSVFNCYFLHIIMCKKTSLKMQIIYAYIILIISTTLFFFSQLFVFI